ncbi:FtsK/SpoIIIE domain-containing protein [Microbacterium sp. NPDC087591]|uniref:FtsK/SpoIIIE domain-containing protein n=1 Tax=Microbacterium sp. NPDC087591 TaxID=3364192 RepID=UPI00382C5275
MITWADERRYWASEKRTLRIAAGWLVILGTLFILLHSLPGVGAAIVISMVVVVAVLLIRRLRAGRDVDAYFSKRWKASVSDGILSSWTALARNLRLEVRGLDGGVIVAGLGVPVWEGWTCLVRVHLPPGLVKEDLVSASEHIAQAFGAIRVSVAGDRLDALVMRIDYTDPLAESFWFPLGAPWDGHSVLMGLAEDGSEWRLPLGPHTLVAGASGSGKASLVWGLLLGLAQPIRDGFVEVWGIDRKGGMELAMGREMLTRFADDAQRSVALLEEAVEQMQARARSLAGLTRQHIATTESPTIVVLIDELAALTAYETDRDMLRRANAAIATLASQGRAVGFIVFACLQDPRKETLPARGLFTQTVGLRLRDRAETAMVLGDGAVAAGALSHEISRSTPGVAFVVPEDGTAPIRVRAAYASDEQIREAAVTYPAPYPRPVKPAERAEESRARRPRAPRSSKSQQMEES